MPRRARGLAARWARLAAALLAAALAAAACGPKTPGGAPTGDAAAGSDQPLIQHASTASGPDGLDLRLADGKQGAPASDRRKLAPAKRLADADAQALLRRVPALPAPPGDPRAVALRPGSQPPPRTGQVVQASFPPPGASTRPPPAGTADGKELRVVRWMPEGPIPLAPELSVTFSQPMVAVTAQADAAAVTPVKLVPQPPGRWRWIGTRTIVFDPTVRFPQATTYQVEVPAGTRSATGAALASATRFSFETPPPTLRGSYPPAGSPQRRDVAMFAIFDQRIDPAAVLARVEVRAGGKAVPVRPIDANEVGQDRELGALVDAAKAAEHDGRWLAFRAVRPLPADAEVVVTFGPGTPSSEGPLRTRQAQSYSFRTYAPLRVERAECGYDGRCPPGSPLVIELNNPLDEERFDPAQVTVVPAVPDLKITATGERILVSGLTEARTAYRVRVAGGPRGITDRFGQGLAADDERPWRVGDAEPTFFGPSGVVVLDPAAARPTLDFYSTNYEQLKVRLYRVSPRDFGAFQAYLREQWNRDRPPPIPGTKVVDALVKTAAGRNKLVETAIDLAPALGGRGLGHAIAIVEPHPWKERYEPPRLVSWVQSTRLAVDAFIDEDSLTAFASDLATGRAAAGVAIEVAPLGLAGTTDARGLAAVALPAAAQAARGARYVLARRGDDSAFVADPSGAWGDSDGWVRQVRPAQLAWYVIDDRRLYMPGEEVSLKGWLRVIRPGKGGDLAGLAGAITAVTYTAVDSRGNKLGAGTLAVNAAGGFDGKLALPRTPNLGDAMIQLEAKAPAAGLAGSYTHGFQIQEVRRPEFEVSARASQGPFLVGGRAEVTVSARYFAGGPLAGAPVSWAVTAQRTSFSPPNRDDYTFGEWVPWWLGGDGMELGGRLRGARPAPDHAWTLTGQTDATGSHTLALEARGVRPAVPMALTASATVTDVNRQAWSAAAPLLVHPAELYVGLKAKRPFVERGQPYELSVIGVDLDGKVALGARMEVRAVRLDWEYARGRYVTKEVDPQTCAAVAAMQPSACTFATARGGTYQITATIVDGQGRLNSTKLTFWVAGGDSPPAREVERERVQIIPDRAEYAPGTTAELLIMAPFYPAEGVVSWRRSGIVKTERIELTGPTQVVRVPITDALVPNVHVQVDLVGAAVRVGDQGVADPKLPKRPAYAVGAIDLAVPPKQRTLAVQVTPSAAKLGPGEQLQIAVAVADAQGRPVADAEVAVIAVDEAILSLTGYQIPHPIGVFYAPRSADATDHYLREYVKLARPDAATLAQAGASAMRAGARAPGAPMPAPSAAPMQESAPEADGAPADKLEKTRNGAPADGPVAVRTNFNPLAAFAPAVRTDASGRGVVQVKLPDNLTRYRIVAVATAGERQFGKGESAVTARLPLMVRPSPPRFLSFGDVFRLPVVVQNQTDAPLTVRLAARAVNAALTDGVGREVVVLANDRVEVQLPAAAELAGTARFQLVGASGSYSDAAEVALPVWTPATSEAFATYGVIDAGAVRQPIALPGKVIPSFGGLEVSTASTNLQALTDAVVYLVGYPFECAEQRASRVLAIAALRDVLSAFSSAELPSAAALGARVTADLERLAQLQNGDGGFAYWERGRPSEPYVSVYVASALARARAKGLAVAPAVIERAKGYLRGIEQRFPSWYPAEVRWAITAYALHTRRQLGEIDVAGSQRVLAQAGGVTKVSLETAGWLLGALVGERAAAADRAAIVRHLMNRVAETAGAASFTTSYGDGKHLLLASDRRVDAVVLEALIQEQPSLDLIPKLVTGLLGHRKAGRWLSTQENTFALLALDRYFQTYEKATPDFVARVWLGAASAGEHAFRGRSTATHAIAIPMSEVAARDGQALTIQKDGGGRLYYRVGMRYAPASLQLAAADHGFVVERTYEGVDAAGDVLRQPDGTWRIKAGARVRIRLTVVNESRRYHVAVVDPLPAGLEPLNPALAVTGPVPQDPAAQQARGPYWWWYGPWYEHQNLRDERVEAFTSLLWEGVHRYDYVARATTPGTFVVAPPKAEEMYMPETFGRGASDRVIVE